jgi:adenosylmethionine-8-amino-7-oxononanoate aminotransferase
MSLGRETRLWHAFAEMGAVRDSEFVLERGEDVWVFDSDGRRYFDGTASLWYANVGHGRRELAEAALRQFERLEAYSTFADVVTPPARDLADRLSELAPMEDARIFLTTGGGEAIETAAKLARRYWDMRDEPERVVLISRENGYHGTNGFGTSIAGIPANREGFGPLVQETAVVDSDSADALEEAIARVGSGRVAAFFLEPVIGGGGVLLPPPGYIEAVRRICTEAGVLLVIDSVICGFGRLGTWFGIERFDVIPDMICFAKGVTSGYLPVGGVVISGEIAAPFWTDGAPAFRHGPTYSGHAVCCAVALANIDLLERENLLARARDLEGVLHAALMPLERLAAVDHVRGGLGLLAGVELAPDLLALDPRAVGRATALARAHGVLVRPLGTSLAISPPLTATSEHFELLSDALGRALAELEVETQAVLDAGD